MSKPKKKLSRKFKLTLGISLASLFLISAVAVALIPQRFVEAYTPDPSTQHKAWLEDDENNIPTIKTTDPIYTTGDGEFQFAYISKASGGDKVAVICGYDFARPLPSGNLTINDTLDAYVKFTDVDGTEGGYVAVSLNNEPLYYATYKEVPTYKPILDSNGNTIPLFDDDGNPVYEKDADGNVVIDPNTNLPKQDVKKEQVMEEVIDSYFPCYYKTYSKWANEDLDKEEKLFYKDSSGAFQPTTDDAHKRMRNAQVCYIANQNVKMKADGKGWELSTSEGDGIFSKATNIVNISLPNSILGVGNYAFKDCNNLNSVTFGNGINTIGNFAFSECHNLKSITIPDEASVKVIGEQAFYNCQALESFKLPTAVYKIGDSCFEGCTGLKECILDIPEKQMSLKVMGYNVFKGCSSLEKIEFPVQYNEDQDVAWFQGCSSLKHITIPNRNMTVKFDSSSVNNFNFDDFKALVPEEFYFEGVENEKLHTTCTNNSFAFKFLDKEIYEKVYNVNSAEDGIGAIVYRVDNNNNLVYFSMDDAVKKVTIPNKIGPYGITKIGADSFQGKHNITLVEIPSSITEIEADAFKGCHKLKHVIFNDPSTIQYIGSGAFATQVVDKTKDSCTLDNDPFLSFTGEAVAGSVPFDYAMNKDNYISNDEQSKTYITFYTGWPSNQEIRYNPDKDTNEVVAVPTLTSLKTMTKDKYPYLTNEQLQAAINVGKGNAPSNTNEENALNSVLNVSLDDGVTGIKEGLFSGLDSEGNSIPGMAKNNDMIAIYTNSVKEIDPYTFASCGNLSAVGINDNCKKIGEYAFSDCDKLNSVFITNDVEEIGERPFDDCEILTGVVFEDDGNFTCSDGIIFSKVNGENYGIIEALETRKGIIESSELAGVKTISDRAFKNCDEITTVDFSDSDVKIIPEGCFEGTDKLFRVDLNESANKVMEDAFKDSSVQVVTVPGVQTRINKDAFNGAYNTPITIRTPDNSIASDLGDYTDFNSVSIPQKIHVKVFKDKNCNALVKDYPIYAGDPLELDYAKLFDVSLDEANNIVFKEWNRPLSNITTDIDVWPLYEPIVEATYTVIWKVDGVETSRQSNIKYGENAVKIESPTKVGLEFEKWVDGEDPSNTTPWINITKNTEINAVFKASNNNNNNNNGNNGNNNNGNNGNNGNATLYTVTVEGGSGSGSYTQGASVIITANNPESGKVFDKWTTEDGVTLLKADMAATYFTMPAKNVTVKAVYKEDTKKESNNNNSSNNNGSNNNSGTVTPNTTVSLTKSGFSNNSLASASVTGSSDNFVLKITDSQTAKAEIEDALLAKYDSLDNIKYVAMDISLYNAAGTKKIENTSDLKVSVTLPIPDDLAQYAGNNQVAYVVNGKLVELNPKFTTINGVPCINFVAPHFSPYTIYVDTSNLSSSGTYTYSSTSTPKTGDGLAVKWYISIGLFAMSVLFFALCIPTGIKKKEKQ